VLDLIEHADCGLGIDLNCDQEISNRDDVRKLSAVASSSLSRSLMTAKRTCAAPRS
jgi:hypothetical protein